MEADDTVISSSNNLTCVLKGGEFVSVRN